MFLVTIIATTISLQQMHAKKFTSTKYAYLYIKVKIFTKL